MTNQSAKEAVITYAIIIGALLSLPLGMGLAYYNGDPTWLLLCAPIVIFLS